MSEEMGTGQLSHKRSLQEATPVSFSPFPFAHWYDGNNSCQQAAAKQDGLAHPCLSVLEETFQFGKEGVDLTQGRLFDCLSWALDGGVVVYSSQKRQQQGFRETEFWYVDWLRSDTAAWNSQLE